MKNLDEWIANTLERAGLPPVAEIKNDTEREMRLLEADCLDGPFTRYRDRIMKVGRQLFQECGPTMKFSDIFKRLMRSDLSLPPVILGGDMTNRR